MSQGNYTQDLHFHGRYCERLAPGAYRAVTDKQSDDIVRWELIWLSLRNNFLVFNNDTLSFTYYPASGDLSVIPYTFVIPLNGTYSVSSLTAYLKSYIAAQLTTFYGPTVFTRIDVSWDATLLKLTFIAPTPANGGVPGPTLATFQINWSVSSYNANISLGGNFIDSGIIANGVTYNPPNQYNLSGIPFVFLRIPDFLITYSRDIKSVASPTTSQISSNKLYNQSKIAVPLPVNFNAYAYYQPTPPLEFFIPAGWNQQNLEFYWFAPDGTPLDTSDDWVIECRGHTL